MSAAPRSIARKPSAPRATAITSPTADHTEIRDVVRVEVSFARGEGVRLAYLRGHDFTQQMLRKIVLP